MELMCAWWNCGLSPPKNGAKKRSPTPGFFLVIADLLRRGTDILGLCEVDSGVIAELEAALHSLGFPSYRVVDLYSHGKSINDFCLIYNTQKISEHSEPISANTRDLSSDAWMKAGVFVRCTMIGVGDIFVGLSHWQSRITYPQNSIDRVKLGQALRTTVAAISQDHPDAPILLLGDFNDEPYDASIVTGLGASRDITYVRKRRRYFYNPFWNCLAVEARHPVVGSYQHASVIEASGGAVYDQIMFSVHFLDGWRFKLPGIIIWDISLSDVNLKWNDVSDHYPVLSHLEKI